MHRQLSPVFGRPAGALIRLALSLGLVLTALGLSSVTLAQSPIPVPPCGDTRAPQCLPPTDPPPSDAPDGLEGTTWLVTQVVVDGTLSVMPADGPVATMTLEDGRAMGDGGCNAFTTSYVLDGATITFDRVDATRRQCLIAAPAEDPLFEALPLVARWSITDGVLTLEDPDRSPLVVLEPGAGPGTGIRGLWHISGLAARDGTAVDPARLAGAEATFGDDRYRATVGCNWIVGTYAEDGPNLTITPGGRTKMYCEGLMDAEDLLLQALGEITSSATDGDTLVLTDDDGTPRIWLTPRGAVDPAPSSVAL
ncbi:MAG: META domain-containing protein [Chloroflexi bacterium]|nr:META domain-containing protein [Chloroflexota bacterium]